MSDVKQLAQLVETKLTNLIETLCVDRNELTIEVSRENLRRACVLLRDDEELKFEQLIDVCGVDYLHYGVAEWTTEQATSTGFERAAERDSQQVNTQRPRFASVYHLLSVSLNHRLRLKVNLSQDDLMVDSVIDIWASADWFERETFDLYGILYEGHPDLRRILTDYGFVGHPFRKDFPLSGHVEMRYDATEGRVIYEPVSVTPRVLVPKVIRNDNRYTKENAADQGGE